MKKKLIMLLMLVLMTSQVYAISMTATITADNNYALFHGIKMATDSTDVSYVGRNETTDVGVPGTYNWSEAESFSFSMAYDEYIYIAAWSDDSYAQGLLGQFNSNSILTKANAKWEYWLTYKDLDVPSDGPSLADLASEIAAANTSGWTQVTKYVDHGLGPWGTVAGISLGADWIWGTDLVPGSNKGEWQLFRYGPVVPEPSTMFLLGSLATGLFGFAGLRKRFTK